MCLDAASAAAVPAAPLAYGLALAGVTVGSITDQSCSLWTPRLLPFRQHGQLDHLSFLAFLGGPRFSGMWRDRAYLPGVLAASLTAQGLTDREACQKDR
ncbi:hypothetical protein Dcar01_00925 [Deinococcus carri]|uniref:Uncharacterized protein n=1 Tax=Deinococcus carri TaxID=1211323 RepID=A0ABP9W5D7_9DEIO